MEGSGTPASMDCSTVQRPSPDSSTYGESPERPGAVRPHVGVSPGRGKRCEDRVHDTEGVLVPPDHEAVPLGKPPDPAAGPGVENSDPAGGKTLRPSGRFLVERD